jgi:hypothetical protein
MIPASTGGIGRDLVGGAGAGVCLELESDAAMSSGLCSREGDQSLHTTSRFAVQQIKSHLPLSTSSQIHPEPHKVAQHLRCGLICP